MVNKKEKKDKDQLQEESHEYIERQKRRGDILFEKWSKTDIGCGNPNTEKNIDIREIYDISPDKARLIAGAIENEERYLQDLNETIIQSDFSTTPENLLKIVKRGIANSNRDQMFHEVALDYPFTIIFLP